MKYYIGVDSGGSHCKGVLISSEGDCLILLQEGPCSATGTPFEEACQNLRKVIEKLMVACPEKVSGIFAGISGCGNPMEADKFQRYLNQSFPEYVSFVSGDTLNPLYASVGDQDAIVAICGTGSGALAIIGNQTFRVDLDGYLFGDEAGGFALGRSVISHALCMEDGRVEKTLLHDLCGKKLGGDVRPLLPIIYEGGKQMVASFAPIAFEAMEQGDQVAKSIVDHAVQTIVKDIEVASTHFGKETDKISVVLCGSLWRASQQYYKEKAKELLSNRFELIVPALDPAFGAAVLAAKKTGYEDIQGLIQKLKNQQKRIK